MSYCQAISCISTSRSSMMDTDTPKISFHLFPVSNPQLLKKWLQNMRRPEYKPSAYSKICSYHFEDSAYYISTYSTNRRLRPDAVPTIFKFPSHSRVVKLEDGCGGKDYLNDDIQNDVGHPRFLVKELMDDDEIKEKLKSAGFCPCLESTAFCPHYISLIEEKAKNHKLTKRVGELEELVTCLEKQLFQFNVVNPYQQFKEEEEEIYS